MAKDSKKKDEVFEDILTSPDSADSAPMMEMELEDGEKDAQEELTKSDILSMVFNNEKKSTKYKKDLIEKASKEPKSVQVETPAGWMTVDQAAKMGFNPETGEFEEGYGLEGAPKHADEMANLSPEQQAELERMMQQGGNMHQGAPPGMEGMMPSEGMPQEPGMEDPLMDDDMTGLPEDDDPLGGLM